MIRKKLYQDTTEQEAPEKLAEYFNISNEYQPLNKEEIPETFAATQPVLQVSDIESLIKNSKRTKFRVKGDLFVNVLVDCLDVLALPVCAIFNEITKQARWPALWKIEYVTVIPKSTSPASEAKCRSISCTNFLSKIYERLVLSWCQSYVMPKENQYGGQKGCSTYHFLADTFDRITEHLEDSRAASVLTSIDYSKAFNRIEHLPLLQSFAKKGVPTYLLKILAAFLSERKMTVKLGSSFSKEQAVNAGAPQRSVLGTYVFNVATDDLEDNIARPDDYHLSQGDLSFLETQPEEGRAHSTPERNIIDQVPDLSPICLLYTSPSPRDRQKSRMPSSA